ncbi:GAF domain-containing protein [Cyclobacterium xiamenense]|uniref:GAF domain-containing protein n=1 Tax=Cyclobacterium xiamenense TaxID=1297121 RepID=UPI0012BA30E7|nr:GAF domain-containing protein [Cyclobacterium xiamenense]
MSMEEERLAELQAYEILDTPPEKELDELAEIASLVCDTPISLITLIDQKRQWFKANKGLEERESAREDSFCQHALHKPKEILVVNDSLKDARFRDNPYVTGDPNIRFYAGAPLETPSGNVLGTLCVLDSKPRKLTSNQEKALQLLAKKAMDFLNTRKKMLQQRSKIALSAEKLKKITDNIPGGIFQLIRKPSGKKKFEFISEGIQRLYPSIDPEEWLKDPNAGYRVIHPDDVRSFKESHEKSYESLSLWYHEFRVAAADGHRWHMVKGRPEKKADGTVVWYGSFQDITSHIEYELAMEQILFDISHILRRPVTNLLGLTKLISNEEKIDEINLREYSGYIQTVAEEMEEFTKQLNEIYQKKKEKITGQKNWQV